MKKRYYIVPLLLLCGASVFAQNKDTKKADKYFNRLEYVKAIEEYEELVEDGDATPYVYKQLGDAYYNQYNTKQAASYYKMYLDQAASTNAEVHYRYAQALRANKDYQGAKNAMQAFANKAPQDSRAKAFMDNPDYADKLLKAEPKFTVEPFDFNSGQSDFGAYVVGNTLYFVSARNQSRRTYGWNDQPTLDIFKAEKVGDSYQNIRGLEGDVNSKFHDGPISITEDGQTMYFTRNDYFDGDYEKDSEGVNQLKIFKAKLINGEWDDIQSLPFNNSEYSTGHTALSPDGKTLYFSSDMPGGQGDSDLYKVSVTEDGSYGDPQNLGSTINTPGKENFPFVDSEGRLYFASDGHLGLGGLDVFYVADNGAVKNMGQPINSSGDDFAYSYDNASKEGFVSSNRGALSEENVGNDNIYQVVQIQPLQEIEVMAKVVNAETGDPVGNASVVVYDDQDQEVAKAMTATNGSTSFNLPAGKAYMLQVNAEEYESNGEEVGKEEKEKANLTIELEPIEKMIQEEEIVLEPIYFDFDKATIRKQAAFELDKLVSILEKHPEMKIKVEAHTDKRGDKAYNQQLSERRAKSTVDYVVSQGIDKARIDWEAFGESKPKVDCSNCSEEQYQENRRSRFLIMKE